MNLVAAAQRVAAWALVAATAASAQPCEPGWHSVGGGTSHEVGVLALYPEHGRQTLFAGGGFGWAGGLFTGTVARWDGFNWSNVGNVIFDRRIEAMIVYDDGSGPALYVGGSLRPVPGFESRGVARWNGTSWSAVGSGLTPLDYGPVTFATFDHGTGPALYAGGMFAVPGVPPTGRHDLARWDGTSWSPVGAPNDLVWGLTVFDDGSGPALWVAGGFTVIGGVQARHAASWNGTTWLPRHGNRDIRFARSFGAFENRLYISAIIGVAGFPRELFARWAGSDWEIVGLLDGSSPAAAGMDVWDDGTGLALYVTGRFTGINGVVSPNLARFDGENWSAVANGYPTTTGTTVVALGTTSAPLGPALYIGGYMATTPPGLRHIGRYTSYASRE
jgi:hypothetical protein